ncbi:hypothetical protein EVJ58_g9140, partial [Rhodofomes roseus]
MEVVSPHLLLTPILTQVLGLALQQPLQTRSRAQHLLAPPLPSCAPLQQARLPQLSPQSLFTWHIKHATPQP